jgi:Trypsin-like peptidase domain
MFLQPRLLRALYVALLTCGFGQSSVCLAQDINAQLDQKLKQAASRLADAFAKDLVFGQFVGRGVGVYVFTPEDTSLPILAVENPERVNEIAVGPRVAVSARINQEEHKITIVSYKFDTRYAESPQAPNASEPLKDAAASARSIISRLELAARPGAQSVNARSLDNQTALGVETLKDMGSFVDAYRAALDAGKPADAESIAKQWRELRAQIGAALPDGDDPEYKTLYGASDNYAPWRYDRIFTDAAAVVAIGEPGEDTAICSGVLVAENIVLTAGHCFSGPPVREPSQLEILFGYAKRPDGSSPSPMRRAVKANFLAPPAEKWPDLFNKKFSQHLYDYALIQFETRQGEDLIPEVEIVPGKKVKPEPQCLRETPPDRADPLYVIGYPRGGPATIHDNGRVELPYRVMGNVFDTLRLDVDADFLGEPDHEQILSDFDNSYILDSSDLLKRRYLFDIRENGQPRMGVIADTFRGNSGGPVYDHEREQCVVGILNRGMGDTGQRLEADWKVHERVLPMKAIIDDLRKNPDVAPLLWEDDGTIQPEGTIRVVK